MNTLSDRLDGTRSPARRKKLSLIDEKLNDQLIKQARKGNRRVKVSVNGIGSLTGLHERTIRSVGFPDIYDRKLQSCNWVKWKGLIVDLEEYFEETGIVKNPENFWNDSESP